VRTAIQHADDDGIRAVVLDCEIMPFSDVTAARMLNQLAAVAEHGQTPEYHRTVAEAVTAARTAPAAQPAEEG
jgi:hypothetical protein